MYVGKQQNTMCTVEQKERNQERQKEGKNSSAACLLVGISIQMCFDVFRYETSWLVKKVKSHLKIIYAL